MEARTSDERAIVMQRGVAQLMFSYLPGKTVDWEDGLAIVQLAGVRLKGAWEPKDAQIVLKEVSGYLGRWRDLGGVVSGTFPDPEREPRRFTMGEPESIDAVVMEAALHCMSCSRLVFRKRKDLHEAAARDAHPFRCPTCGKDALRQFPQVFVHGCGNLVALDRLMPIIGKAKNGSGDLAPTWLVLECRACGANGIPEIQWRSERARDLIVTCQRCKREITRGRLTARCHACFRNPPALPDQPADGSDGSDAPPDPTLIDRVLMRGTSYRASEAYYGHSLTILRLDRPQTAAADDDETALLRALLPSSIAGRPEALKRGRLETLMAELQRAQERNDASAMGEIYRQIGVVAASDPATEPDPPASLSLDDPAPDVERMIEESLALKTQVHARPYAALLAGDAHGATAALADRIRERHNQLGLRPTLLVDDLPVITATFGHSRRSFEPVYEETDRRIFLPTTLHPFTPLGDHAARRINKPNAAGTFPILAREGDHEGIFLGLDAGRVARWLTANGRPLPDDGQPPIVRILRACEPMGNDRYYDTIWTKETRRLVFGLLHSLSHAAMRAVTRFAGLERTSLSEYLFLPLLGTVIYANSSTFKMGNMETMLRSSFYSFLAELDDVAMSCLMDTDCIDHRGACAGCLHAPEISCRVFNHGLSRSFLRGGHTPWVDASTEGRIVGYWEL